MLWFLRDGLPFMMLRNFASLVVFPLSGDKVFWYVSVRLTSVVFARVDITSHSEVDTCMCCFVPTILSTKYLSFIGNDYSEIFAVRYFVAPSFKNF